MLCEATLTEIFEVAMSDTKKLNTASFFTEFGAITNKTDELNEIDFQLRLAEEYGQSTAYWQFKYYADITTSGPQESLYDAHGNLETNKLSVLSRTYFRAIGGTLLFSYFSPTSGVYTAFYAIDKSIKSGSEIYLNQDLHYPKGFNVRISPDASVYYFQTQKNIISLFPTDSSKDGEKIQVIVTPL